MDKELVTIIKTEACPEMGLKASVKINWQAIGAVDIETAINFKNELEKKIHEALFWGREFFICPKCKWQSWIRKDIAIKCPECGYLRKQVEEQTENGMLG